MSFEFYIRNREEKYEMKKSGKIVVFGELLRQILGNLEYAPIKILYVLNFP